jgi:hypothetical protein
MHRQFFRYADLPLAQRCEQLLYRRRNGWSSAGMLEMRADHVSMLFVDRSFQQASAGTAACTAEVAGISRPGQVTVHAAQSVPIYERQFRPASRTSDQRSTFVLMVLEPAGAGVYPA